MNNETFLLCGPYIGDFKQELLTFRPWITWIKTVVKNDKTIINTHFNRACLYEDEVLNIDKNLTLSEHEQKNYFHKSIHKKEYMNMSKNFKEEIISSKNISKKYCKQYNLSYVQFIQPYSIYQKIFTPISIPEDIFIEDISDYIVIIPDEDSSFMINEYIINELDKNYKYIILGDKKIHFYSNNLLLTKYDYNENIYKYILKYISACKCVITPTSHWTFLCNLQKVPVFSWGTNVGLYKTNGDLHFNNNNVIMYVDEDTNKSKIVNQIKWFINERI